MTKVAINGFGRIGRLVARAILERPDCGLELVAINDLADAKSNAWLFSRDSVHGKFPGEVSADGNDLIVDGKRIHVTAERDPAKLPHGANGVELALECTGFFADKEGGQKHLDAGAKRVLISAPAKGADLTVVYGVNDDKLTAEHRIVSNASCTTNCLAPVAKVLNDTFGIESGLMTTVHAYTNDQNVQDLPHQDPYRARGAAQNIIPTSTGAASAVGLVIPELKGKLTGIAMRVPVATGSVVDLTVNLRKETTRAEINAAMKAAAEGALKNILSYTEDPIVSSDIIDDPHSSIFAADFTQVLGDKGKLAKVISWYDNEWGYSHRVTDLVKHIIKKGL